jgi:hypothetical protein
VLKKNTINVVYMCSYFLSWIGYIGLNWRIILSDELERIRKEAVIIYFKVLSQHVSEGTEANHENIPTTLKQ